MELLDALLGAQRQLPALEERLALLLGLLLRGPGGSGGGLLLLLVVCFVVKEGHGPPPSIAGC